jgi:hypothetical protein
MTATPPPGAQGPPQQGQQQAPQQQWPQPDQQQWQQPAQQPWQQPDQQPWPQQAPVQQAPVQQGWPQQAPVQQGWPQQAPQQWQQPQYLPQRATGEYGYRYGEMPQYPTPQFPPPSRPPQRGIPGWMWAMAAVLVIAVVAVFAIPALMDEPGGDPTGQPTDGPTQPVDDGFGQPNTSPSGTFTGTHMLTAMNEALAARDRDAFFRFVEGEAAPALNLWWDNMDVLQWDVGAISLAPGQLETYEDDTIELRVTLGAATAGSPTIPEASDHPDAGLSYAPSNIYRATIRVTDDGESGVISGWEIVGTAAPWDLEPLYAVVTEHSVMAGYADERELVDRIAPLGDAGASWVIETFEREQGVANAERFTTFVTEDADRFNDWFISDTSGWVADRAGTMFPQRRPYASDQVLPSIATGGPSVNAGGVLTIGPNGLLYGPEDTQDTIVHEFVHAIHTTNVPQQSWPGSPVMEGWATYNEGLYTGDGEFATQGTYVGRVVRSCIEDNPFDGQFPVQDDFTPVETVHCAYMLSGTMYAYAASLGVNVYEAADHALLEGLALPDAVADMGGPVLDASAWWSWLESTYGS